MPPRPVNKLLEGPRSLASIQVDVLTRLGAALPTTTTGLPSLDALLGGGLRSGTHLLVCGSPGVGKTAFAVMLAYIAARAKASVLLTSVGLDDTEIVARLTARALHREYQNVTATYGTIWSGVSMQDPALRAPISGCLDGVVKKVGENLHLFAASSMEDVAVLADQAAILWAKNERVVLVVDGIESYATSTCGSSAGFDARMSSVAHELSHIASQGCAVITTCDSRAAPMVAPAATVVGELRSARGPAFVDPERVLAGARPAEFDVVKNRLGPSRTIPLVFLAAASVFEEQRPQNE